MCNNQTNSSWLGQRQHGNNSVFPAVFSVNVKVALMKPKRRKKFHYLAFLNDEMSAYTHANRGILCQHVTYTLSLSFTVHILRFTKLLPHPSSVEGDHRSYTTICNQTKVIIQCYIKNIRKMNGWVINSIPSSSLLVR